MDDLLIRRLIGDALRKLKKSIPPGSDEPRTDKELRKFLEQAKSELQRFNIPIPGTAIDMPSDPPKGIAWAVKVAMCNQDKAPEFIEFVRTHGQSDVYLAALALSSSECDDHGEIRALQAALELLKESAVSSRLKTFAELPRSPFSDLVLKVLTENRDEGTEGLWEKLEEYQDHKFDFKGQPVEISLVFDVEANQNKTPDKDTKRPLDRRIVHWDSGDKLGHQLRRSFDSMISKLRKEHGLSKSIRTPAGLRT